MYFSSTNAKRLMVSASQMWEFAAFPPLNITVNWISLGLGRLVEKNKRFDWDLGNVGKEGINFYRLKRRLNVRLPTLQRLRNCIERDFTMRTQTALLSSAWATSSCIRLGCLWLLLYSPTTSLRSKLTADVAAMYCTQLPQRVRLISPLAVCLDCYFSVSRFFSVSLSYAFIDTKSWMKHKGRCVLQVASSGFIKWSPVSSWNP